MAGILWKVEGNIPLGCGGIVKMGGESVRINGKKILVTGCEWWLGLVKGVLSREAVIKERWGSWSSQVWGVWRSLTMGLL